MYIYILRALYHVTTESERGVASFHVSFTRFKTGEFDGATASDVPRRVC